MAHLLAASALVHPASLLKGTEADGEAFNVTDGKDEEFWYDVWLVVRILRNGKLEGFAKDLSIHTVPVCVMRLLVWVVKWVLLVFTLGFKEPSRLLSTNGCSWATEEHTLDDTKAKTVLRYNSMIGDRQGVVACGDV